MKPLPQNILERVVHGTIEPVVVVNLLASDWPIALCNSAYLKMAGVTSALSSPLADVVEPLHGRDLALELSEAIRFGQEVAIPVERHKREYLLVSKLLGDDSSTRYCALYWRSSSPHQAAGEEDIHYALRRAMRRIRDLSRDDPATGLLNETAFREVLAHDWAVTKREKSTLALTSFQLEHFDAYLEVFGRHATDSCLRRVAQAVRRCMRRASDVAARITADGEEYIVVLSHAAEEPKVMEFAERITKAVRDLGLHHPRSASGRFVTVTHRTSMMPAGSGRSAKDFLQELLKRV